jgi:uncharacterized protein (DUF1800 family)
VGHYGEADIREAARAFTGGNFKDLAFVINRAPHDDGDKTVLGRTGRFDGVGVIDIILAQPVTAEFVAGKICRFFAREDVSPSLRSTRAICTGGCSPTCRTRSRHSSEMSSGSVAPTRS